MKSRKNLINVVKKEGSYMYFKNADHKSLFEEYQAQAGSSTNREYSSALHLLAGTGKPLGKYIRNWNIDIRDIVAASILSLSISFLKCMRGLISVVTKLRNEYLLMLMSAPGEMQNTRPT
jgi:hypothetical protein